MKKSIQFFLPLSLFCVLLCGHTSYGQKSQKQIADSVEVSKTLDAFLVAFTSLEYDKFMGFFDSKATAFFPPSAKTPARANNKSEVGAIFKKVFENARKLKSAPPYLDIQPKDVRIQSIGSVAIVTFHLEDPDLFGRRSIVFENVKGKWLIVHLHSSGVPIQK